jgi:hypothetical protein
MKRKASASPVDAVRALGLFAAAVLLVAGCSVSDSIESSSKIISSPITSISGSSGSGSAEASYSDDVRDYTATHVRAGGSAETLREEVASLAGRHGISDWRRDETTFRAVGAGLAKAGMKAPEMDAFRSLFATTLEQGDWLEAGYEKAAR